MPKAELHALHRTLFNRSYRLSETLLRSNLVLPAHDYCLKCSHMFNLLDASGGDRRDRADGVRAPRAPAGSGDCEGVGGGEVRGRRGW